MNDPLSILLPRLGGVRQFGKGWRADCPCGHKSRGTLSLTQGEDGRLLLHCFAGCAAGDILSAVGSCLADLYADRLRPQTPEQQRELRQSARQAGWAAALGVLSREATIVAIAAETMQQGQSLASDDVDRLRIAANRIHDVRGVLAA